MATGLVRITDVAVHDTLKRQSESDGVTIQYRSNRYLREGLERDGIPIVPNGSQLATKKASPQKEGNQ